MESLREIEKSARENMLKLEHKIKKWCTKEHLAQIRITAKLINGFSTDEILEYSRTYKPALIVMGTRGLTRDNYKAFGRFVNKVIAICHRFRSFRLFGSEPPDINACSF